MQQILGRLNEDIESIVLIRWEEERAGLMQDIKEMEQEHQHEGMVVAKERFKNMMFRYRVLNKIQKMKDFHKESYEFTKANLEI